MKCVISGTSANEPSLVRSVQMHGGTAERRSFQHSECLHSRATVERAVGGDNPETKRPAFGGQS